MDGFQVQAIPVEGWQRGEKVKALVSNADWLRGYDSSGGVDRITGSDTAYALVPLIYRAVKLRADAISSVPIHVWQGERDMGWPFEADAAELIWKTEAALMLCGFALWLKTPNERRPKDVQWVNPYTVKIEYDEKSGKLSFRQEGATKNSGPWTEDQVVYFQEFNPKNDLGAGISPASVSIEDARLLRYLTRFAGRYFENGAMPVTLLGFEYSPSDEEAQRVEKWFRRMATGIRNAWRVLALRGKVSPTVLTPPPKDLEMKELNNQARHNVAMAFGIPQTMLEDAANYATAGEHRLSFWQDTVRPRGRIYEGVINRQLFKSLGMRIQLDFEEMGIFQVDEAERSGALYNLTQAGFDALTAAEVLGYQLTDEQRARIEAEAAQPTPTPTPTQPPPEGGGDNDLRLWEKKALRRLKDGKRAACEFTSAAITAGLTGAIEGALEVCETADEVRRTFAGAVGWEGYP